MNVQERLDELDRMTVEGNIMEALEKFYHPDLCTQEGNEEPVRGKEAHHRKLIEFYADIANVNKVTLHNSLAGDNVSMSKFTFDITTLKGGKIIWNEILRREWRDGLVIHEKYYTA